MESNFTVSCPYQLKDQERTACDAAQAKVTKVYDCYHLVHYHSQFFDGMEFQNRLP